jgi:GH15 family glucan-1,4-alpha-glucosidase
MSGIASLETPSSEPETGIGDYALIGDCRTAALVSQAGSIDWLCLPHFSGQSVFAAILDQARGGAFVVRPTGEFRSSRRYVGDTAVLETTFVTDSGKVRLTDLMPVTGDAGALRPMRELLRIIEGIEGDVVLDIRCEPRPDYARKAARVKARGAVGFAFTWGDELILLQAEAPLELISEQAVGAKLRITAGQRMRVSLSYAKGDIGVIAPLGEAAEKRVRDTLAWWTDWSSHCTYEGPHREMVLRSAVTLKLLTFALSGAVVAAPTTSLPEALGGARNWDYRYCWLRDAALTMRAFTGLGFEAEAGSFIKWLLHATRLTWPELQVMYDVYGRTNLDEERLDHLSGYRGSRPLRIGNSAHDQLQLDVYGGVVSAAVYYVKSGGTLQPDEAKLLAGLGETVCKKWREPDNGIWEIQDPKRQYTFSKVMCWAALDGLIELHEQGLVRIDADRLRTERDAVAEVIETRGYSQALDSYVGELDGNRLDAALLLTSCLGYKDARHPRMIATLARIRERLEREGLLYRYEEGYDGLPDREGTFGICSFWAVETLAKRGEIEEAHTALSHVFSFANDVGLFAEQIDPATGTALATSPKHSRMLA